MLTSSKSIERSDRKEAENDNDTEDTASREAPGATDGEKPSKDNGSPGATPTRNKVGEADAE